MTRTAMAKRKRRDNLIAYLALALVVFMIIGIVSYQAKQTQDKLNDKRAVESELDLRIEAENARTEELLRFEKEVQTDAYAEEQAREKLKLLKDNQIMFVAE